MALAKTAMTRLPPTLLAGGINGVIEAFYSLALGAIVFSGPLHDYLPIGLGLGLFTTIAIATVTALTSSLPGIIGSVQDVPAILLSLVLATILTDIPEADLLPTAIGAIAVTTLSMGLVSLLLGMFKLGDVIRYVPFPVIGGFLGGTGWFIVLGSLLLLTGLPEIASAGVLIQPLALVQLLPGVAFAVAHVLLLPRYQTPLLLPVLVLVSLPLFYLTLGVTGTSLPQAENLGLLLGPFLGDGRWHPLQLMALAAARWDLILGQWQSIGVLLAVTLLAVLLNLSSLEIVLEDEMDLNQELKTAGLANLVSGLGGGMVGFHGLGSSVLGYRAIRARSRWVGVIVALCAALALALGAKVVGFFPRFVLGGLGLSLGYSFLDEWLWKARQRLSAIDYAIVVAITLTMAVLGVLPGVGLGLVVAIATFLINYSRIDVVRHQLSGQTLHSSINRAPHQQEALQAMGDQIQILKLQGFLFFGTANQVLGQVKQRLESLGSKDLPQFMVLDFEQVTGMDVSVAYSFSKLKQVAKPPLKLVLTHLRPAFQDLLIRQGCLEPDDPIYHLMPDLNRGLEWCEAQLLETLSWRRQRHIPLALQLQKRFSDPDHIGPFMEYLEKIQLPAGATLFEAEDVAHQLYFLESGQVSTVTLAPSGEQWERTYTAGTMIGATAFCTQSAQPIRAVADQASTLYRLTHEQYQAIVNQHCGTASTFQAMILSHLAEQVHRANADLKSLLP
jgi:sulfate permease, SulP family